MSPAYVANNGGWIACSAPAGERDGKGGRLGGADRQAVKRGSNGRSGVVFR